MRSRLLLVALPAALLGLAACDDQTAQNNTQSGAPSTAERPATAPPPAASPGGAPSTTTPGATTPGAGRPAGSSGNTQ
jgi:hypothetical protein